MRAKTRPTNHSADRDRRTGIRAAKRCQKPTLDALVHRFGFTSSDLTDPRIMKLVNRKLSLDQQIADLINSGFREDRIAKFAELIGFKPDEFARDSRISWLVGSIFDARRYLAGLKPSRDTKPNPRTETQES